MGGLASQTGRHLDRSGGFQAHRNRHLESGCSRGLLLIYESGPLHVVKACAFTCVGEFRIRRLRIATDPFRNFRNSHANPFRNPITRTKNLSSQKIDVAKKKKRHYTPPSGQPAPRFPACQFAPRNPRGAVGSNPSAWKILSRPCPLCVSRTPRQTSGLPAGTEPSFESRVILASTNSKNPAAFEEYQENGLHLEYQPHPNTSRIHTNMYG